MYNPPETALDRCRDVRALHVQEPRQSYTEERQPEHRSGHGVCRHGESPVEMVGEFLQHRMRDGVDEDCILEEVAEEHWLDADVADDHGWNRQHDQGQSHHPGCFVRVLARRETMVVRIGFVVGVRAVITARLGMVIIMADMAVCRAMGGAVAMRCRLAKPLFAMEDQEIHAERIEGRHEDAGHYGKVGETGTRQV